MNKMKLMVTHQAHKFPTAMTPEASSPCSQEPAHIPYHEAGEFSPCPHTKFIYESESKSFRTEW